MELIREEKTLRYYQLDFKIKKYLSFGEIKSIKSLWEHSPLNFKPEFELGEDISESINKICISDAFSHIERLVFPSFMVKSKIDGKIFVTSTPSSICGKHTMLIHGGDIDSVYDDKVYIRRLRMLNR